MPGNAKVLIYDYALRALRRRRAKPKYNVESYRYDLREYALRARPRMLAADERAAYKIGSASAQHPLRPHRTFGADILSAGQNTIESVGKAVAILESAGPLCAAAYDELYPTPPHLVRLGAMVELGKAFPRAVIGLSDHTTDNVACLGAVSLGASILERHFTDRMDRPGPDIVCSMDEQRCGELIAQSRTLHAELGGTKGPAKEEQVTIDFAFATVVTIAPVKAGEPFTMQNLWVKRPGTGPIPAERFESILGKRASRDIPADTHLAEDDFNPRTVGAFLVLPASALV